MTPHPIIAPPIIAVIGLGTMGLGIAQLFAGSGFTVLATDAHAPTQGSAIPRLTAALNARVTLGKLTAHARDKTLANLRITPLETLAPATLAIEAIIESLPAKQALLAQLETILSPEAILATNTSSLSVTQIAARARHPGRVLGLHFFNPAPLMKLVELIPHATTSTQALALARHLTEATGKTVITCPDRPGFIVNRCARPYYGEALALLEEGHDPRKIDAAMQAEGYRLGPFALIDLIGADINLAATEGLYAAMQNHPRYYPFNALKAQVASGNLGHKTGHGFLAAPTTAQPNPAIALRIAATLINEAAWLHAEGPSEPEIDTAVTLGLNFPHGPFAALHRIGKPRIVAQLNALDASAPPHLKTRYRAAPLLESP